MKLDHVNAYVAATFALVTLCGCGVALWRHTARDSTDAAVEMTFGVTNADCYCAVDLVSVRPMLHAYHNRDVAALGRLQTREKTLELLKGTRMQIINTEAGVSMVRIESGFDSGRTCYVSHRFVE